MTNFSWLYTQAILGEILPTYLAILYA